MHAATRSGFRSVLRVFPAALLVAVLALQPLGATQVRLLNLETMTERADRIFSGRVESVRVVDDGVGGRPVTLVRLKVERAVKGRLAATTTIKLLGDRSGKGDQDWIGLPDFHEGEQVVLFLYADSGKGFTSPVGLSQGKFGIQVDKQGRRHAMNAIGNRGLQSNLSDEARHRLGIRPGSPSRSRGIDPAELLDRVALLMD